MSGTDISIVTPIFNEKDTIPRLIEEYNTYFQQNKDRSFEVIFVDDGSKDNSVETIMKLNANFDYKIVKFSTNFGSHAALRAGFLEASGKCIVNIYADLQEPLDMILKMFAQINQGEDVVWAYRKVMQSSFSDRVISKLHAWCIRKYVHPDYPENGLDFVMFNQKIQKELNHNVESNSSFALQIFGMGFKQSFIEYTKDQRKQGTSKWTFSKKLKVLIDSFVSFSYLPIRMVSLVGISFFIVGICWALFISVRKFMFNHLATGWPALLSVLMIGFGVTNIGLGIIAEYLWRTFDVSRNRPVFIVDEIIDSKNHSN